MKLESLALLGVLYPGACATAPLPRSVRIKDQHFVHSATQQPIVLTGPNVVVKGE
jgi:hypothetical protein